MEETALGDSAVVVKKPLIFIVQFSAHAPGSDRVGFSRSGIGRELNRMAGARSARSLAAGDRVKRDKNRRHGQYSKRPDLRLLSHKNFPRRYSSGESTSRRENVSGVPQQTEEKGSYYSRFSWIHMWYLDYMGAICITCSSLAHFLAGVASQDPTMQWCTCSPIHHLSLWLSMVPMSFFGVRKRTCVI